MDKYLIINAGSSSLKFSLYDYDKELLMKGYIERIGKEDSFWNIKIGNDKVSGKKYLANHKDAVNVMLEEMLSSGIINSFDDISGIGHRILHGGELYSSSVIIDDKVLKNIKSLINLGPLHLPSEIQIIEIMKNKYPNIKNVAIFDTSFHHTIDKVNYMYPVPYEWYSEYGVRKYGFHGTSYRYITKRMQKYFSRDDVNLIVCHIGSGASVDVISNGISLDTSMGLTPLDGLMMGTRSGSIDASIVEYIARETNKSIKEINDDLNKNSGLYGICGCNDYRDVIALCDNNDEKGKLALSMLCNSIIKYISYYYFLLDGKLDAIIFTAGIGENGIKLREMVVNKIANIIDTKLDIDKNNSIASFLDRKEGIVSTEASSVKVMVIATDEEEMMLEDTIMLCNK